LLPKFLKFKDLKERGIVTNRPTLIRWIADEGFPAGVKLGPNVRAWDETSILNWLADRPKANGGA
jgi:predicted DNA-binding transcriptional regulator AlpA